MEQLDGAFEALVRRLAEEDGARIRADEFPPPSEQYTTENIIIRRVSHQYNGVIIEGLTLVSDKNSLRRLAILILSDLVVNQSRDLFPTVQLTSPLSELRKIQINTKDAKWTPIPLFRSKIILDHFQWFYKDIGKHPWCHGNHLINKYHYPQISISQFSNGVAGFSDPLKREVVIYGGCIESICNLVDLLLNISDAKNSGVEFALEGEAGFRGVNPYSAEISFNLPGSVYYDLYGRNPALS